MTEQIFIPDEDYFADQLHHLKEALAEEGVTLVTVGSDPVVVGGGNYSGRGVIQFTSSNKLDVVLRDIFARTNTVLEIKTPRNHKSSYHEEQKYLKRNFSAFKKRGKK